MALTTQTQQRPEISVIGPAKDEEGNLEEFVRRCLEAFAKLQVKGEVIIIDDGSVDGTARILQKLVDTHPDIVRGFRHRRNMGLTAALKTGFGKANGEVILWISPDLESHPDTDIPILYQGFLEGHDVVVGARIGRADGKSLASKIYNLICRWLFGLSLRDMNWIKGFRRECLSFLHMRGDWHRFIVIMLYLAGFSIVEKDTNWHNRVYGQSKFGLMRFPRAFIDAISIWFILNFSRKPMRFFGSAGGILAAGGILIHLGLVGLYILYEEQLRPLFLTAMLMEIMGIMLVMFGFIAELIERMRDEIDELRMNSLNLTEYSTPIVPSNKNEN